jgi:hypothetical protein
VAPLILDEARAAREEAQRLRADSHELRRASRASIRTNKLRKASAAAALATARTRLAVPSASPWSGLSWLRDDEALHNVLVLVD